ncbi:MAG: 5'/3'-nucleotidase SurE [Chloroherpetonaceae bacterium]|nr:5'/3'-nucleotidase SurE [Chthonomonadaceae bacterium]MDW8206847.1 5'/3'-nucleotidase SurE [Chloroherpetonaceae bacterium]
MIRILLTNDDGIHAPGIHAAREALSAIGEVFMVAPERQRSAAGHAITLHKPLRLNPITFLNGQRGFATNGTPTDCVTLGFDVVMEGRCDLVVSGINAGPNLGWDLTYSGTVAAAIEGAVLGIPSFAISVAAEQTEEIDYRPAARFAALLARRLLADPLPPHTLLNVNVPAVPEHELRGVAITHQGRREYVDRIVPRVDPAGRPYYWQAGSIREDTPDPGCDVHAILEKQISVTPVHLDLTAYSLLDRLRAWDFDLPACRNR